MRYHYMIKLKSVLFYGFMSLAAARHWSQTFVVEGWTEIKLVMLIWLIHCKSWKVHQFLLLHLCFIQIQIQIFCEMTSPAPANELSLCWTDFIGIVNQGDKL